MTYHMLSGPS